MKNLSCVLLTLLPMTGFTQKTDFEINLDSVKQIVIIDHQNFNYEWYCGRIYDIAKLGATFSMHLLEQYNKPYYFGEEASTNDQGLLDISNSQLMEELDLFIDQDSAINLANGVVAAKHSYWAELIKMENNKIPLYIATFDENKLYALVDAINDRRSRSPRYILKNLGMDSTWIAANAARLFDSYKLSGPEPTPAQRDFCISCFLDKEKAMRASFSLIGTHNTYDYPYIEIQFIQSNDTLSLYTDNPWPLSMPLVFEDSIKYYNPKISLLLAEILPDLKHSNKERLSGDYSTSFYYTSIEEAFARSVLYRYCTEFKGKKKRRRKRVYIDATKFENK
ncbi:hypothetical protein QQ020_07585 [Fulvivirgaceae bacterium BMA12]|uniref:Uncharacterized protein n=1 Tax=Agaribacillus aureus TaxID=3051825 RepID=A0ABT8L4E4_9BACT|nr:hypothetical protein [Fulvivirgaceae bacterium BMA12]